MLDKIKDKWNLIVAALGALVVLLIGFKLKKGKDAEAALENAEVDKKDAVLDEKHQELTRRAEEALAAAKAEKGRDLTKEEMEKFLKDL